MKLKTKITSTVILGLLISSLSTGISLSYSSDNVNNCGENTAIQHNKTTITEKRYVEKNNISVKDNYSDCNVELKNSIISDKDSKSYTSKKTKNNIVDNIEDNSISNVNTKNDTVSNNDSISSSNMKTKNYIVTEIDANHSNSVKTENNTISNNESRYSSDKKTKNNTVTDSSNDINTDNNIVPSIESDSSNDISAKDSVSNDNNSSIANNIESNNNTVEKKNNFEKYIAFNKGYLEYDPTKTPSYYLKNPLDYYMVNEKDKDKENRKEYIIYCLNYDKQPPKARDSIYSPYTYYGNFLRRNFSKTDIEKYVENKNNRKNIKNELAKIILAGYGHDKLNIQKRSNMGDEDFRTITQVAIWMATSDPEDYDNVKSSISTSNLHLKAMYDYFMEEKEDIKVDENFNVVFYQYLGNDKYEKGDNLQNFIGVEILKKEIKIPLIPLVPAKPIIPQAPVTPQVPEIPEIPQTPVKPEIPQTPVKPEIPQTPVKPEKPQTPVKPEIPQIPVKPEIPQTPVKPEKPQTPVKPEKPQTPVKPEIPQIPVKPEKPQTPVKPEIPQKPKTTVKTEKPQTTKDPMTPENIIPTEEYKFKTVDLHSNQKIEKDERLKNEKIKDKKIDDKYSREKYKKISHKLNRKKLPKTGIESFNISNILLAIGGLFTLNNIKSFRKKK